jgi:gliding motility associated protien GldN
MKNILSLLLLGVVFLMSQQGATAQDEKTLYQKQIQDKRAIPYPFLREADVMWSKQIWRVIDLREKMNFPLYYPTTDEVSDRLNLFNILLTKVKTGELEAYNGNDWGMTQVITFEGIEKVFDAGAKTFKYVDPDTGEEKDSTAIKKIDCQEVKQLILKEEWYFDKKLSTMKVRILGICPVRVFDDPDTKMTLKRLTFWVFFPDVRNTLANYECFNSNNDAQRISFDDLFMQRRFSSYIVAESNVYDNRQISQYAIGKNALLESEKVKQWLFEFEHDLWEY